MHELWIFFSQNKILPDINLAKYCTSKMAHPVVENSIHWEYNFLFLPTIVLFYKTLTSLNKLFLFSSILSLVSKQDMDTGHTTYITFRIKVISLNRRYCLVEMETNDCGWRKWLGGGDRWGEERLCQITKMQIFGDAFSFLRK